MKYHVYFQLYSTRAGHHVMDERDFQKICTTIIMRSGAAGTMRMGSMGMCDESAGLRYLQFSLFLSPQRAQRFEGSASFILGGAGGRIRWRSRVGVLWPALCRLRRFQDEIHKNPYLYPG